VGDATKAAYCFAPVSFTRRVGAGLIALAQEQSRREHQSMRSLLVRRSNQISSSHAI
jgi:hypothetical protein